MKSKTKSLLLSLLLVISLSSCGTSIYLCENTAHVKVYETKDRRSKYTTIPSGKNLLAHGKKKKEYREVRYGNIEGYAYKTIFKSERKLSKQDLRNLKFDPNEYVYIIERENSDVKTEKTKNKRTDTSNSNVNKIKTTKTIK